jgi:hypothetical protein
VGLAYALMGTGVGLAGTPASHSLTGSVPVDRAGMASGTADLQWDLGGAITQSVLGALLTAGCAAAFQKKIAATPGASSISDSVRNQLEKSFAGAQEVARQYPAYVGKITTAAKSAFLSGDQLAYLAGIAAVLAGAILVFLTFPGKDIRGAARAVSGRRPAPAGQRGFRHRRIRATFIAVAKGP